MICHQFPEGYDPQVGQLLRHAVLDSHEMQLEAPSSALRQKDRDQKLCCIAIAR
jgi:hypothetical protein